MANEKFAPLCVWCNEPWSDENVKLESVYASGGCDTCGYGQEISGSVVIKCHKCGKKMYEKEFSEYPNG